MLNPGEIPCPFVANLAGVRFPCQLAHGHWGKCLHDLVSTDVTLTWFPTHEERAEAMAKMLRDHGVEKKGD